MGKRHQILVVWGHFTWVKSLLSDFSLHWVQNWFNGKVKYSKYSLCLQHGSLNSHILLPLFWQMLWLFWPHHHLKGHPSHVTIVGPGNGRGSWSASWGQGDMAGTLGTGLMTGLNVTRPDRSLARNSRADRGNNFKVHSHQANPTHDINLRFFTFCKLASSFNVNDNGWNIKTIYSVMC